MIVDTTINCTDDDVDDNISRVYGRTVGYKTIGA